MCLLAKTKKGLPIQYRPFICCAALLHECRKKAFEKNPLLPSGQSLLVSESPIEVGVSDPSRPDFPEYGYRFFQIQAFYTGIAGVSPQFYYIPTGQPQSRKYCKEHLINAGPATSLGDDTYMFFGPPDGLSPGNSRPNSIAAFSAATAPTAIGKRPGNRGKRGFTA